MIIIDLLNYLGVINIFYLFNSPYYNVCIDNSRISGQL